MLCCVDLVKKNALTSRSPDVRSFRLPLSSVVPGVRVTNNFEHIFALLRNVINVCD